MTTTSSTDTARYTDKIIALRDRARHAGTPAAEAETALNMARKLCTKYGIDPAILDAPTVQVRETIIDGSKATNTKKYSCRFGCGMFVQHTIEELNACAEKARNANGGTTKPRNPFEDLFAGFNTTYSEGPTSKPKPKAPRSNGSHKYCDHEATKTARAKCRKDRGF